MQPETPPSTEGQTDAPSEERLSGRALRTVLTQLRTDLQSSVHAIVRCSEELLSHSAEAAPGLAETGLNRIHAASNEMLETVETLLDPEIGETQTASLGEALGKLKDRLSRLAALVSGTVRELSRVRLRPGATAGALKQIEAATQDLLDILDGVSWQLVAGSTGAAVDDEAARGARLTGGVTRRLLVVDDDRFSRSLLTDALRARGFEVEEAADGEAALAAVVEHDYDLVLLALVMPGMSGKEVLSRLRQDWTAAQLPVIAVTGVDNTEEVVEVLSLGANDYVTKPVDFPVALARIGTHLALRGLVRELEAANRRLEDLSTHDPLTGVPNRRRLDEKLTEEWLRAARDKAPLSLIMIDIDHFKSFNDTYGHDAGDQVLQQVAAVLAAGAKRPADLLARFGGEEFVALLPATPTEGAQMLCERFRTAIDTHPFRHAGRTEPDHVTISLGVATFVPKPGSAAEALIKSADNALYEAKENGRNRFCVGATGQR